MTTRIIGEGEKLITTVLLNGERLHVRVHEHASGQNVFSAVVDHLGLNEISYFGLMIIKDGEQQFLDLEEKLNRLAKYAPHLWKDDGSCNSSLVFTVFFRVKYYVENICLLQEQQTRHQYYLQLRKDVLENSIRVHDDTSMILASYALQTELGDYDKSVHAFDYFVPQHYLPAKTIAKLTIPYIKNALPAMHQSHRGLIESQAEIEFLKEAQKLSEYGVLFNRVYKKEFNNKVPFNVGICVRGLVVYEETGPVRNPVCKHPWAKVKKMSFKRNKFIVESESTNPNYAKMMFYTTNYKRSKYLLAMSSSFFNFQMMMASRLATLPEHLQHEEQAPLPVIPPLSTLDSSKGRDIQDYPQQSGVMATPNGSATKETPKAKPRPKPEAKQYTLDLVKKEGSFGFSIVGGIELGGIFVKDVTPGGPAAQSGSIKAGDRIVQINKDSFENVTRREAINTLRNAPDKSKFIMETFGQNLVFEADKSIHTPLAVSAQSLAMHQPQIPVVQTERESEFIRIELPKKENTFGIGFTGGPELGGVYVKSLLPNGSAETDGRVAIGDRIVEVDGVSVETFSRKKIQELLKQCPANSTMTFERYKQIPAAGGLMYIDREKALQSNQNFISITLNKKNDSLGFSITGGLDLGGIFVKYLNLNGPAAVDGRLEVGDRVVAVNDISLETATRQKALEIIRTSNSPVDLIIEKYVTPPNVVMGNMRDSGVPMVRSDSIKSLPTSRQRHIGQRLINFSMQHLPGSSGHRDSSAGGGSNFKDPKTDIQMQDLSRRTVFVSDLRKINGSFGISLIGGAEVGGIFVKAVQPGGAADLDRRIQKGDKVVEINARKMEGLTRAEAMDWLKASETATLVLERISEAPAQQLQQSSQFSSFEGDCCMAELQRKNRSFGLCLMGGPETRGVFVKNLMNEGAAALNGRINRSDRVLEVNGISTDGLTAAQVHDLLKQSPNVASVLVERVHNADDVPALDMDIYSVELKKADSGFGISLTGGVELGGIYVKGILPGGYADTSHKINKGDRLLEVNGVNVEGLSKQQASDQLRKAPQVANFIFEHNAAFDSLILPESEFFTVEIRKKQNGYGLSLTGGPEIDGVYVKQVQRDSAADQDGRIKKGDRIITINGRNVENSTRQQCTEMLKLSQDIVVLHLERCVVGDDLPPLDTVLTVVELIKDGNGFGISLTGGPEIGGIFVKALMPGGVAEKDTRIYVGDRVVEMNSVSLDGYTRQQATELLKNSAQTATFVLERYKQNKNSMRKYHRQNSSTLQTLAEESTSAVNNHFSFPLYNGAAPSVPPRHQNSGIPSRESAFKRLEQQQQQQQHQPHPQHQPSHQQQQHQQQQDGRQHVQHVVQHVQHPDHQQNITISVNETPIIHHQTQHNVQGGSVSSRIPSLMQHSFDREQAHARPVTLQQPSLTESNIVPQISRNVTNIGYAQPSQQSVNNHPPPTVSDPLGSLSLIEQPLRRYANSNEVTEDSPQRFLQQFSKSVITDKNVPPSSRVPLGPISSVIFGNNTGTRGVHEITDIQEDALPDDVQNLQDDIRDLRILRDTMYKPTEPPKVGTGTVVPNMLYNTSNKNKQHGDFTPQQDTIAYLSNGRPTVQVHPQSISQPLPHQQHQHQQQHNRKNVTQPHQTSSLSATPGNMVYTNELRLIGQPAEGGVSQRHAVAEQKRPNYQQQNYRQQPQHQHHQQHQQQQHQQQQQRNPPMQQQHQQQQQQSDPEVIDLDKQQQRVKAQYSSTNQQQKQQPSNDSIATSTKEPKKPGGGGGLQWMSLNDPTTGIQQQPSASPRKLDQNTELYKHSSTSNQNTHSVPMHNNNPQDISRTSIPGQISGVLSQNSGIPGYNTGIPRHNTAVHQQQNVRNITNNPLQTQHVADLSSTRQQQQLQQQLQQQQLQQQLLQQQQQQQQQHEQQQHQRVNRNGSLVNDTTPPRQQLRGSSSSLYVPPKTGTSSSNIPVPLASKFNPLPHKSPLDGGDYIFEVTLFKGTYGLGMNLVGGGSPDNPVSIKKIASGTAADECGQLSVGDILLEVNGKPVSHLQAKEVISLLRACPSEVQLLAKRLAFDSQYRTNQQSTTANSYVGL